MITVLQHAQQVIFDPHARSYNGGKQPPERYIDIVQHRRLRDTQGQTTLWASNILTTKNSLKEHSDKATTCSLLSTTNFQ